MFEDIDPQDSLRAQKRSKQPIKQQIKLITGLMEVFQGGRPIERHYFTRGSRSFKK